MTISRTARLFLLTVVGVMGLSGRSRMAAKLESKGNDAAVLVAPTPMSAQACRAEPMNTSGTIYYACDCQPGADPKCVPGSDGNRGTSPSAPWRTYGKLRGKFSSIRAGDTVAFCRGGSFRGAGYDGNSSTWTNTNCTAATACVIRDYVDPRWTPATPGQGPILTSAAAARGMDLSARQSGIRVLNLKLLAAGPGGDGFALSGPGTGPGTDITICNVEVNGFSNGIEFYRSAERLTVVGSRFVNNNQQGILGGSDGTIIKDSDFDNNGTNSPYPPGYAHAIYLGTDLSQDPSRYPGPLTNVTISGNKMTNIGVTNGVCSGPPLVAHGAVDGMLIENNYIDGRGPAGTENGSFNNGGCFGIMISPGGYHSATYFRHVTIRRNRLLYTGNQAVSLSECSNCVVEANEIVARRGASAIYMPHDYKQTRPSDPDRNTEVIIQNNTIYYEPGASGTGITIRAEGDGYVVSSNVIYYAGSRSRVSDCFNIDSPSTRLRAMDHNLCYSPHASSVTWATGYRTRLEWATSTGWDTNSLAIDPQFKSISGPLDFTPCRAGDAGCSETSPLIGAGDPAHHSTLAISAPTWTWSATDQGRKRDPAPDMGAYER